MFVRCTALFFTLVSSVLGDTPATLPESPARDVLARVCTSCHPLEQILIQRRSADEWDQVIAVMLDRGAVATEEEQAAIREYLAQNFGAE